MADPFADVSSFPPEMIEKVIGILETRGADPANRAILDTYLASIDWPDGARVLELGCGTGAVARVIVDRPQIAQLVATDLSADLIDAARRLSVGVDRLEFRQANACSLDLVDESFDVAIMHTLLSHVPDQHAAICEAFRILKPDGQLVVCDADFSKMSLAIAEVDPVQSCCDAFIREFVTDRWLIPRLPAMMKEAGFAIEDVTSYGRLDTTGEGTALAWISFATDLMERQGLIGTELAAALRAEGARRKRTGQLFGFLPFASVRGRKMST